MTQGAMTDYLTKLSATLRREKDDTRVLFQDRNVLFGRLEPETLRERINEAMRLVVAHLTRNVERSPVELEPRHLEEAALRVVLHHLSVYNAWRTGIERHKDHPLRLEPGDLTHPQTHDACWSYCERTFGAEYAPRAAALCGMSLEEFSRYQAGRRAFWER